ncbi:MAG: glucosaminidase domain-containing protein [Bacteroidota bacterium]
MEKYTTIKNNLWKRYHTVRLRAIWWKLGIGLLGVWLFTQKDISVQFHLSNTDAALVSTTEQVTISSPTKVEGTGAPSERVAPKAKAVNISHNLANTYSNLTYQDKRFATSESGRVRVAKREKQRAYVAKYVKIAQQEMKQYGIPASIILAQGLIESNCGDSRLATKNNNHFGMKCFSRKCKKGHCSNFTDDSHKDFFRIYPSVWESYRAHSKLLMGKRYKSLQKHGTSNYVEWAKGLKKAGYATDPHYANKLIAIIESLELDQYDR